MAKYIIVGNDELYHHGIKGQKWGIRRFQNEDGSLTEAGKKRYLNNIAGRALYYGDSKNEEYRKLLESRGIKTSNFLGKNSPASIKQTINFRKSMKNDLKNNKELGNKYKGLFGTKNVDKYIEDTLIKNTWSQYAAKGKSMDEFIRDKRANDACKAILLAIGTTAVSQGSSMAGGGGGATVIDFNMFTGSRDYYKYDKKIKQQKKF